MASVSVGPLPKAYEIRSRVARSRFKRCSTPSCAGLSHPISGLRRLELRREWSAEGAEERRACFEKLLSAVPKEVGLGFHVKATVAGKRGSERPKQCVHSACTLLDCSSFLLFSNRHPPRVGFEECICVASTRGASPYPQI